MCTHRVRQFASIVKRLRQFGKGWIRTTVAETSGLQPDPIDRSGTLPYIKTILKSGIPCQYRLFQIINLPFHYQQMSYIYQNIYHQ